MWCVVEQCEHEDGHYVNHYYFKKKDNAKVKVKSLYKKEYDKYMENNEGNYDQFGNPEDLFVELSEDRYPGMYDYKVLMYQIKTDD